MTPSRLSIVILCVLYGVDSSETQEKKPNIHRLHPDFLQQNSDQDPTNFKFDFEKNDSLGSFENWQSTTSESYQNVLNINFKELGAGNKSSKTVPSVQGQPPIEETLQKLPSDLLQPADKLKTILISRNLETDFDTENVDPKGRNQIELEVSDLESELEEENSLRTVSFEDLEKYRWAEKRQHSITQYNQADTACAKISVNDIGTELLRLIQPEDQVAPIKGTNYQTIIDSLEQDWLDWKFTYGLQREKGYGKVFFNNGLAFYTSGIHRVWTIFKKEKNVWKLDIENAQISFKCWRAEDRKPPTLIYIQYSDDKIKITPHNPQQFIPQIKRFKQVTQLSKKELKKYNRAAYNEYPKSENGNSDTYSVFFGYYHFQSVDYEDISTKYRVTWMDSYIDSFVYENDLIEIDPEIGDEVTVWIKELGPEAEYICKIGEIREIHWFDNSAPGTLILRNEKQYGIEWEDIVREEIENSLINIGGGFLKTYFEENEIIAIRNIAAKRKRDE